MDMEALRLRICQARRRNQESRGGRRSPLMADKSRVSRVLFDPPDHEENLRFVRREMDKAKREAEDRWNFDFENEKPKTGRFEWLDPDDPLLPESRLSSRPTVAAAPTDDKQAAPDLQQSPAVSEGKKSSDSNSCSVDNKSSTNVEKEPGGRFVDGASSSTAEASAPHEQVCSKPTSSAHLKELDCDKSEVVNMLPSTPKKSDALFTGTSKQRSRLKQTQMTGHFQTRKRSKSKVKTQERKSDSEQEYELEKSQLSKH